MELLVTGGAGYVGSVTVPLLLAEGHRVRVLDVMRSGAAGLEQLRGHPTLEIVVGDVCDDAAVRRALEGVDAVVHLAAIVGYPACCREPELARRVNIEGTRTLVACRQPGQRLVFASTGSVYGAAGGDVCTEETPLGPLTLYGRTKAAAEELVRDAGESVSFRYATAFGVSPCMRFDLLPNHFTFEAVRRGALDVYQGAFRRTLIHVHDIARSIVFALDRWSDVAGGVYNVGDESLNVTKAEVADRIRRYVDYRLTFSDGGRDPDQRNYAVSYERIRAAGFSTTVDLDAGIFELVAAARSPSGGEAETPLAVR